MRSRPPQIGRPILHEPHQATAFVPIPDRSKSPASGSRKKGIDSSRPVTEASCAKVESTRVSHHRSHRIARHSLRNGFNGLLRALLGEPGFVATIAGRDAKHRRQLDISVGTSGPHDFAVRLHAARHAGHQRPPHPAPTSVTIAKRPSRGARDANRDIPVSTPPSSQFGKSEIDLARRQPRHCRIGWRIVRGQSHRCLPLCGSSRRGL